MRGGGTVIIGGGTVKAGRLAVADVAAIDATDEVVVELTGDCVRATEPVIVRFPLKCGLIRIFPERGAAAAEIN